MLPSPLSLLSQPPSKGPPGQFWCGVGGFPRRCCLVNTRCSCFDDISWWSHWDDFWEAAVWKWRSACEFQLSFKIKILLFVIWREVQNMFLPRSSECWAEPLGKPCGFSAVDVLAVPCPSIGISPWSHVFSLIVIHFYHVLLSIFSLNLFLISNSMLLIFLTSVFSWDTS